MSPTTPAPRNGPDPSVPPAAATGMLADPDARFGPDGEPLDPREIARGSLEPGRNISLWVVTGGVAVCVAASLVWGAGVGGTMMAVLLAVCAVVRAVMRAPGPVALVVRRRAVDVGILGVLAVVIGVLSWLLPFGGR